MKLSSLPVAFRVSLAVAVPIIALCIISTLYILDNFNSARQMERVQHVTDIGQSVSRLVHELQKERGSSAGFVGAKGTGEFPGLLAKQKLKTDEALNAFQKSIEIHLDVLNDPHLDSAYNTLDVDLGNLNGHRQTVQTLSYNVQETVGPYTGMIAKLLEMVALSTHDASGSDLASDLTAFLALMNVKENAGVERAIGSNAFAGGAITQDKHERVVSLISNQNGFLKEFRMLMSDQWDEKLDANVAKQEWQDVIDARRILVDGLYRADQNLLTTYTGPEWFALTTKRIELLMEFETYFVDDIDSKAEILKEEFSGKAYVILWVSLVSIVFAGILSALMIVSVVRPIKNISAQLGKLADGETDIRVSGQSRKDEIGVLSRAADAFLVSSKERQELMEENTRKEQKALEERRQTMRDMADEVKFATKETVMVVSEAATDLMAGSKEMFQQLAVAKENAGSVDSAAQATMEATDQASTLANELSIAISEVAENVVKGDEIAKGAVDEADVSRQGVEELDEAAKQIGDFVNIITELAEQTNLLALNASIESARAGEAGRGFSVVAEEIKQLANQTNRSASQISDRVNQIQSKTENAVASIGKITQSVKDIGEVTSSVAAAIEEQRASTASFSQFLEENREAIKGVADGVGDLSVIANQSSDKAERMGDLAESMVNQSREVSETIPKIVEGAVEKVERRRCERIEIEKSVKLTDDRGKRGTVLADVSQSGASIIGEVFGDNVKISIEGVCDGLRAHVIWKKEENVGIHFEKNISQDMVNQIVQRQERSRAA